MLLADRQILDRHRPQLGRRAGDDQAGGIVERGQGVDQAERRDPVGSIEGVGVGRRSLAGEVEDDGRGNFVQGAGKARRVEQVGLDEGGATLDRPSAQGDDTRGLSAEAVEEMSTQKARGAGHEPGRAAPAHSARVRGIGRWGFGSPDRLIPSRRVAARKTESGSRSRMQR